MHGTQRELTASHCVDRMCTLAKMLMMVEKTNTTAQPFMWDINYSTRQTNKKNSESAECKIKSNDFVAAAAVTFKSRPDFISLLFILLML
jgi:hypothetical protein